MASVCALREDTYDSLLVHADSDNECHGGAAKRMSWERFRRGDWTLEPTVWWIEGWDIVVVSLLFAICFYVPFDAVVLARVKPPLVCVTFDGILDVAFALDMCLQFFLAYPGGVESGDADFWVKDPVSIARRYLGVPFSQGGEAGWFWMDCLALFPCVLDLISGLGTSRQKVVTVMRMIRMFRMTKLTRAAKVVSSLHARIGFSLHILDIIRFVMITAVAIHWSACTWIAIEGNVFNGILSKHLSPQDKTWLSAVIDAKGDSCTPDASKDPLCVYIMSLYWSTMTLTSVGYGDITPQNPAEYLLCTLLMFVSGYIWAYIVGSVVRVVQALDPYGEEFKQIMDEVNQMANERGLPQELRVRLRSFLNSSKHLHRQRGQRKVLENSLSRALHGEVLLITRATLLQNVYWACGLEHEALLQIVQHLNPQCFGPGEVLTHFHQALMFVRKGQMVVKKTIYSRGDVVGVDHVLLETRHLLDVHIPRTLSYVVVLSLGKMDLKSVCRLFPQADKRLRRAQIRTAVWRAFVWAASKRRKMDELEISFDRAAAQWKSGIALPETYGSFARSGEDAVTGDSMVSEMRYNVQQMARRLDTMCEMQATFVQQVAQVAGLEKQHKLTLHHL